MLITMKSPKTKGAEFVNKNHSRNHLILKQWRVLYRPKAKGARFRKYQFRRKSLNTYKLGMEHG
jgi:hypothetical protein